MRRTDIVSVFSGQEDFVCGSHQTALHCAHSGCISARTSQAAMPQNMEKVENFFAAPPEYDLATTLAKRQQPTSSGLPSVGMGLNFDPRREDGELPMVGVECKSMRKHEFVFRNFRQTLQLTLRCKECMLAHAK